MSNAHFIYYNTVCLQAKLSDNFLLRFSFHVAFSHEFIVYSLPIEIIGILGNQRPTITWF